jgi:hypothetical protein
MPYDAPSDADFTAISASAKKSPAFKKMAGEDPDADDATGTEETADLSAAFAAAQSQDEDAFVANMLSAIKSCIANYGAKK